MALQNVSTNQAEAWQQAHRHAVGSQEERRAERKAGLKTGRRADSSSHHAGIMHAEVLQEVGRARVQATRSARQAGRQKRGMLQQVGMRHQQTSGMQKLGSR